MKEIIMDRDTRVASDGPAPFYPGSSLDYLPCGPLRQLQSQRLRQLVSRAYEHAPLFRQRLSKYGMTPADIQSMADLGRLPFTTRDDLCGEYPLGMLTVPLRRAARLRVTGGGAGNPILVAQTRHDLERWQDVVVRSLAACGIHGRDVVQNACDPHVLAGSPGLDAAAEALGAAVVPWALGSTDHHLAVLKTLGVSAILCTPSHFLYLIERAEKTGIDLRSFALRVAVFVAEPSTEKTRQRIEQAAGIKTFDLYGLAEIFEPGVGSECAQENGLHIFEDHFYPEVIDPGTGTPLPDGQEGELVLTALSLEAMPLVRYRTSQRTAILAEPCPCGRTLRRIRRIERRSEEKTFVVEGAAVAPAQIEAVLRAVEGTLPPYRIVPVQDPAGEHLEVQIEVTPRIFRDQVGALEGVQGRLAEEIERAVGVRVPVRFVEPRAIGRR